MSSRFLMTRALVPPVALAPAIVAMLSKHDHNQPLAVVSDGQIRGLTPSFFRSRSPDCASPDCVFRFPWAQPAILSRGAMIKLMDVVHKNLLTQECKAFDVTHDVGLGMIMWIASLPFVAVGEYQGEMAAARNRPRDGLATKPPSDLDALMHVHGVRRMGGAELIGGLGASGSRESRARFRPSTRTSRRWTRTPAARTPSSWASKRRRGPWSP